MKRFSSILIILFALFLVGCGSESDTIETRYDADTSATRNQDNSFPPVEANAIREPALKTFAQKVDLACAINFNFGQLGQAQIDLLAKRNGWSQEKESKLSWRQSEATQYATYRSIAAVGKPPAREKVFYQWRNNVKKRAAMMGQMAQLVDHGVAYDKLYKRLLAAKIRADRLAVRFGLRICPSNGPKNNQ